MNTVVPKVIEKRKVNQTQEYVTITTERVKVQSGVNRDLISVEKGSDSSHVLTVLGVDKEQLKDTGRTRVDVAQ
jgi:hypothetical protein